MFNRTVGIMVSITVIVVMLFTSGFDIKDLPPAPSFEPTKIPTPVGQEDLVFINPGGEMNNNAEYSPTFTLTQSWKITLLITIHWNDGNGKEPGLISLEDANGTVYGPWQAKGYAYKEVENVRWNVMPNWVLPPGEYTLVDSDPDTWTNNEASEYVGFSRVSGIRVGGSEKPPAVEPEQPEVPAAVEPETPADDQPEVPADVQPNFPPSNPPDVPTIPLKLVAQTAFEADGKTYQDKAGVQATVPEGTLPNGGSLLLKANQPTEEFDKGLKENGLIRKSNFYKLEVKGNSDSLPNAVISFPSASPGDRVAKLIEEGGLIWSDEKEANGRREVQSFIGLPGDKSPQYVLLGPVEAADIPPLDAMAKNVGTGSELGKGSTHLADLISDEPWPESVYEDCSIYKKSYQPDIKGPLTDKMFRSMSCRRDKTYHIEIWSYEILEEWDEKLDQVDALLGRIRELRKKYYDMGFYRSTLYTTVPIKVVEELKSPLYSPRLGTIYFGWKDVVSEVIDPKTEQTIEHEMFHYIEHQSYNMRIITEVVGEVQWWLEISAETATFLLNPANLQIELDRYGQVSNGGARTKLAFQEPPFDWYTYAEDNRYVQALQYFIMMSRKTTEGDFTCLPDQKGFVDAINRGVDGIAEGNNRKIYRDGNWYFAQYLLNQPPGNMCRDVETGGILEKGLGYGDYVHATSFRKGADQEGLRIWTNNITKGKDGVATISASIAAGAVYPLRVSNGAELPDDTGQFSDAWKAPSVPYQLTIKPSMPYFYKIGDDPMKWNDGTKEQVITPITSVDPVTIYETDSSGKPTPVQKPGIPVVRIVAYNNTDSDAVFNATFEPIPPTLLLDPASLSNLAQNPNQSLTARLENLPSVVTEPVEFKFTQVLADGSAQEISSSQVAPQKGIAETSFIQIFSDPTIKEVRVSAMYKAGNKTKTVNGVIPVVSSPVFSNISVYLSVYKPFVGFDDRYADPSYDCPLRWTSPNTFEYDPARGNCTTKSTGGDETEKQGVNLKGQISNDAINIQIKDSLEIQSIGQVCPFSYSLINIPLTQSEGSSQNIYEFKSENDGADVGAHLSNYAGFRSYRVGESSDFVNECSGILDGYSIDVSIQLMR